MQRYEDENWLGHQNGGANVFRFCELWMGTHPTSPSRVRSSNELLSGYLASHPDLIGRDVIEKFDAAGGNLPFLFKVLSIEKALSIQTHPDKKMAEELHAQHPDIYKGVSFFFALLELRTRADSVSTQIRTINRSWR